MRALLGTTCAVLAVGIGASGCSRSARVAVEAENAPAFGSKPELRDWPGYLEGKWGLKYVPGSDRKSRVGLLGGGSGDSDQIAAVITFKKDGALVFRMNSFGYKIGGHWRAEAKQLHLDFETFDDKPIKDELAEATKDEERGSEYGMAKAGKFRSVASILTAIKEWELVADGKSLWCPNPEAEKKGYLSFVRVTFEDE